jgi:cell wall-associated NlpC family hydrolase
VRAVRALLTSMVAVCALTVGAATASAQTPAPAPGEPLAPPAPPAPPAAPAAAPSVDVAAATSASGGAGYGVPAVNPVAAGAQATLGADGLATAPADAPAEVQQAIWAANEIVGRPYRYGGGHRLGFKDKGYDCSGTVSYALNGAGVLKRPLDSSSFLRWGEAGPGAWITVYTNPGHAFVVIAGLRLDTSAAGDRSRLKGPRWRPALRSTKRFKARHPAGL